MKIDSLETLLPYSKKLNLLYIEDSSTTRNIFKKIFKQLFDEVFIAEDGNEGLSLFSKNDIDIVITDIEMPIIPQENRTRKIIL